MQIDSRRPIGPLFCCEEKTLVKLVARAFVVAGSPAAQLPIGVAPEPGDFVVAADLGARHALAWGWPVHLLVGDLDSLPEADALALRAAGVETVRLPVAKDETDTELALAAATERQPREIIICAGLGARTDHLLANVLLLARRSLEGFAVRLVDGSETVRLLSALGARATLVIDGAPGDLVSLLPLGTDAEGVRTGNLLYPLHDETLFLGEARGISNVMSGSRAEVSLARGRLLVIQNRMTR
jgi:thiamine pyrophosphokinase